MEEKKSLTPIPQSSVKMCIHTMKYLIALRVEIVEVTLAQNIIQVKELTTSLSLDGVSIPVVDHLSFDIHAGKTLALVGESGCGKSMTALSLMGIVPQPPAFFPKGEIIYGGRNLLDLSEREFRNIRGKNISMIFQDPMTALNPVYTIGYQLLEVVHYHLNFVGAGAYDCIIALLHEVGIPSPEQRINEFPHQLSGGMKQRVMIAMALICEPDILIADEPTTALDVTIQAQVLDLMKDLQERKGTAILLITHDMGVVAEMADDVVVMYAARSMEHGPVRDIFDNMAHPYTKGLFNSRPHYAQGRGRLQAIDGTVPSVREFPHGCRFHTRCAKAMERCVHQEPPYVTINHMEHGVRCWLYAAE